MRVHHWEVDNGAPRTRLEAGVTLIISSDDHKSEADPHTVLIRV